MISYDKGKKKRKEKKINGRTVPANDLIYTQTKFSVLLLPNMPSTPS
jgi:hypothetical protein